MSGKVTAGLGILAALILIILAVNNPGSQQPRNPATAIGSPSSTAFRMAGGAVLGAQAEIVTAQTPTLDPAAIEAILTKFLEDSGLAANQADIDNLVARYSQIASQAQALLNSAPTIGGLGQLLPTGAIPEIDPALLASLLNNPQFKGIVDSKVGDQRLARLNQLTGATQPSSAPAAPRTGAPGLGGLSSLQDHEKDVKDAYDSFKNDDDDEFFQNAITFQEELAKLGHK